MDRLKLIREVSALAAPYRLQIAAMMVLGSLAALSEGIGLSLFIPLFYSLGEQGLGGASGQLAAAMDRVFGGIDPSMRVLVIAGCIFAAVLVKNLLQYGNRVLHAWLDGRLLHVFRSQVAERYLETPWGRFQKEETGTLLNTLENETWETSAVILFTVTCAIHAVTILVLASILILISWPLMLLVSGALVVVSGIIYAVTRRVERISHEAIRADERFAQRVLEMLRGMRTVRLLNLERHEREAFEPSSMAVSHAYFKKLSVAGLIHPVSELLIAGLLIAVLFASSQTPESLPAVMTFLFILYRLHPQIKLLDHARMELLAALPSADKVLETLRHPAPSDPTVHAAADRSLNRSLSRPAPVSITFRDVLFRYDDGPYVLHRASFTAERGRVTAIVGPSGAGKSTLVHLLTRFYEPEAGRILVGDQRIDTISLQELRRRVAVVTHDAHLFHTSVYENIRCGRLDATHEEIVEAARTADAHGFIECLPDGYATSVADMGARLSAGQRQRIALARAILRNPAVLVLDEATNGLDSISEEVVRRSLQRLRGDRTILLIAHRLSTIRHADRILVLNGGRVAEAGTFDELLALGGLFVRLFELQHHALPPLARAS